jgi:hypothetical protein
VTIVRVAALRFSGALLVILSTVSAARAQSTPVQRPLSFRSLTARVPQASATGLVTELRIQWITSTRSNGTATSAPTRVHSFKLLEAKMTRGRLRRERRPELSADQHGDGKRNGDGDRRPDGLERRLLRRRLLHVSVYEWRDRAHEAVTLSIEALVASTLGMA